MFLKILVSLFSILILIKNCSYSMYEYKINKNSVGATSILVFSTITVIILNLVLFFIKF